MYACDKVRSGYCFGTLILCHPIPSGGDVWDAPQNRIKIYRKQLEKGQKIREKIKIFQFSLRFLNVFTYLAICLFRTYPVHLRVRKSNLGNKYKLIEYYDAYFLKYM